MPIPKRLPLASSPRLPVGLPRVRAALPALQPLALAAALAAGCAPAWGLPEGAQLRFGQAQVLPTGPQRLDIRQDTARAGLDWTRFSIAAGEQVVISQPGRDAVLVNRVTGNDPSRLFGQLQANGSVWLVNPRGIVFGRDSRVDVGSLVASTLAIRSDEMAEGAGGRLLLGRGPGEAGSIQADGRISAPDGSVVLVAPSLSQGGRIDARRIGLAAATQVQVDVEGDGLIFFNARNDGSLATRLSQLGTLRADGGTAELRAAGRAGFADTVLNLEGVVQARSIGQRNGRIVIDGSDSGSTRVAGRVDASGHADGERGGEVTVLGGKIALAGSAVLDAGGMAGGGALRVGGDLQGGHAETYRPAQQLLVQAGARLDASAGQLGDGGLVVLWSQDATRFAGSADARGGLRGGDGGLVEVSGKGLLEFAGLSDRSAPRGRAGTLLLDPLNLEIGGPLPPNLIGTADGDLDSLTLLFNQQPGSDSRISALAVQNLLAGGDVRLEAVRNITVSGGITVPAGNAETHALTLRAGNDVIVNANIVNKGDIVLSASTPDFSYTSPGPGSVTTSSTLTGRVQLGADLTSTGGVVRLTNNASDSRASTGVHQLGGTITTGALEVVGAVTIPAALTLALAGNGTTTLGAELRGAGTLTKSGADSTLVLGNASNSHGGTTVSGGRLQAAGSAPLGSGALTLAGGTFSPSVSFDTAVALVLGAGGGTVEVGNGLRLGLNGPVSGTSLTKTGTGRLVLANANGANGYTGNTVVSDGTLQLGSTGAAGGGTIVLNGKELDITTSGAGITEINNLVQVADGARITSSTGGGSLTAAQPLALAAGPSTLTLSGTDDKPLVIARALTGGASAGQVVVIDGGVVTLSGNNGQDSTTVASGTLQLAASNAAGPATSSIALRGNRLDITDGATIANAVLDVASGARITSSVGGGTLAPNAQPLTLAAGPSTLTLSGTVNGPLRVQRQLAGDASAGQVVTIAGGVVALSGNNSQDSTTLTAGTLQLAANNAAGADTITLNGTVLDISAGAQIANPVAVVGSGRITNTDGSGRLDGRLTVNGSVTLSSSDPGNGLTLAGEIVDDGANAGSLVVGGGTVTLAPTAPQVNSYSGGTTVNGGGRLVIGSDAVLGASGAGLTLANGTLAPSAVLPMARNVVLGTGTGTPGGTVDTTAGDVTLTGAVSGSSLTKTGSGRLTLAPVAPAGNSQADTFINGGTLAAGSAAALGTSRVGLSNNATLLATGSFDIAGNLTVGDSGGRISVDNGQVLTLNGALSGGGTLAKQGAGQLVLAPAGQATNSVAATVIELGTLSAGSARALGSGALTVNGGARLQATGTISTNRAVTLGAGNATVEVVGDATVLTLGGAVSGNGRLVKAGTGRLVLTADNSYAAGTEVQGGTLAIDGSVIGANADAGDGAIDVGGFTLDLLRGASLANNVTVNGGTLTNSAGTGRLRGTLTLQANSKLSSTATGAEADVGLTLAGIVGDGGGGFGLEQTAGRVTLANQNNFSGTMKVVAGNLVVDGATVAAANAGTGTIDLGANRLDINGGASVGNPFLLGNDAVIGNSAGTGTLALDNVNNATPLALAAATRLRLDSTGAGLLVNRRIEDATVGGNAVLRISGDGGAVTLQVDNAHGGGTQVDGKGTLVVAAAGRLGGGNLSLNDGTLGVTAGFDTAKNVVLGSGGGRIRVDGNAVLGLTGTVSGPDGALTKTGTGTLTLAAGNSHGGGTAINNGTLVIGDVTALGNGNLSFDGGILRATAGLVTGKTVALGNGGGTIVVVNAGDVVRLDGAVSNATPAPGQPAVSGALRKDGDGRLVLAADNGYSGGTSVLGGRLVIEGSSADAGSGTITLNGFTLDLRGGAAAGAVRAGAGATITNSDGAGRLAGALTLTGNATLSSTDSGTGLTLAGPIGQEGGDRGVTVAAGTVVLAGANSYAGDTLVNGGTLVIDGPTANAGLGRIVLNDRTLDLRNGAAPVNAVSVDRGTITNRFGAGRLAGPLTLLGDATLSSTATEADAGLTLSGLVGDNGGTRGLQISAGRITLANANTYAGDTRVDGGTLVVDAGTVANARAGTGTLVLNGNRLEIANGAAVSNRVTVDNGATIAASGALGGELAIGAAGIADSLALQQQDSTLHLASSGGGELRIARALRDHASGLQRLQVDGGTVTLSSADNSFDGGIGVAAGTLRLAHGLAAGAGAIDLGAGNTLDIVDGAAVANPLNVANLATVTSRRGGGTLLAGTAALTLAANTVLNLSTTVAPGLRVERAIEAATGATASTALVVSGSNGAVTLTRTNRHGGGTTVNGGGRLVIASDAALGGGGLTLDNGTLAPSTTFSTAKAIVLSGTGGRIDTSAGEVTLSGVLSGTALTKSGANTLVLANDNSFTGGTSVLEGALAIDAAVVRAADAGSGAVTLGDRTLELRNGANLAGGLSLAGGTLAAIGGSSRVGGDLTLASAATASTLSATGGATLTVAGGVGESVAGSRLTTRGNVVLRGVGSSTGTTTVDTGTLTLDGAGASTGSGALELGAQRLVLNNGAVMAGEVRVAGGTIANTAGRGEIGGSGALRISGSARLEATSSADTDGLTLRGAVSETAAGSALVIDGGGRVTLASAGGQTGTTQVNAGTLAISGNGSSAGGAIALGANRLEIDDGARVVVPVTVANGATIANRSGTGTLATGTLPAAQALSLGNGVALRLAGNGTALVIDRAITDSNDNGRLTVTADGSGSGVVQLLRANSHGGGTTVNGGGTLAIGATDALGNGPLQLDNGRLRADTGFSTNQGFSLGAGGGTLDTGSADVVLGGVISGTGRLDKAGTGMLTLQADNTYAGGTRIGGGVLRIRGSGADAGSGLLEVGGAVLDLGDGARLANAVTIGAGGTLRNASGTGTLAASGSLRLDGSARVLVTSTAPGSGLVLDGIVSGDTGNRLTVEGGGTVTLANANTYRGGTRVVDGTLRIDAQTVAGAGAGSGPIDLGSGTLDLRNGASVANAVSIDDGQLRNGAGAGTLAGTLTLAGDARLASTGGGLLLSGQVTGPGGLDAQGGSITLSRAGNDFAGAVDVSAGTLQVAGGSALPDAVTVTLSGSGRLQLAADERIGALVGSSGTSVDLGNRTLTIGGSADGAMAGTIGGTGGLVKTGSGTLTLSGSNGYTGTTTVSGGTLQLAGAGERLADAGRLVVSGGVVDLGTFTETLAGVLLDGGEIRRGTLVSASNFDLRAGSMLAVLDGVEPADNAAPRIGLDKTGPGTVILGGDNRYRGIATVDEGSLQLATGGHLAGGLVLRGGGVDLGGQTETVDGLQQTGGVLRNGLLVSRSTIDLQAGEISAGLGGSSDAVGLTKSGDRTALLSGANSYRGVTAVQGGTLQLAGDTGVLHDASALRVDGGTLDIGNHDETVRSVALLAGRITGLSGKLTSTEAFDLRAGQVDAVLDGGAGATKTGSGEVTLSRANRYTGETRIDDGSLVLSDSQRLDAASTLLLGSRGTLTLTGDQALARDQLVGGVVLQGRVTGRGTLSAPDLQLGGGQLDVPVDVGALGSTGSSSIGAAARVGTLTVGSGTLTLGGEQLLGSGTRLVVERDATLQMGGANTVTSLDLRGTLTGSGRLSATDFYHLDSGVAQVPLGTGALRSSGSSRLEQPADVGTVQVLSGALTTTAQALFNAAPAVDVAANGQWLPAGSQRIGSLSGAGSVVLDGITLRTGSGGDSRFDGTLSGSGSLVKQGTGLFTLAGSSTAGGETVVEAGTLALVGAQRLADGATVRVLADATLSLDAAERIGALALAGTLAGRGTLTADRYQLQGGRVDAGLGAGALTSGGASTLAGVAAVDSITLADGSLTLTGSARLDATPVVTLAADTTLTLGAATRLGSLAGQGAVALGSFTLTTGVAGDSRFDGTLGGTGGLVKQGDGRFTLGGVQRYSGETVVEAGTLALDGSDRLDRATAVSVARAATLALAGDAHVASLALQGSLDGSGTLDAATVLIDGGRAQADLAATTLRSRGDSRLSGRATVGTLEVETGQLALALADRLSDGAEVSVARDARLTLAGSDRVGRLTLAGTLDGDGILSAPLLQLQGGTAVADLAGDRLVSTGNSRLVGQATVGRLELDGGRLELASAGRLLGAPAATLAAGSTLALGGNDSLGSLAGEGTLALGGGTLRTGAGGGSRFDGVIEGEGGLVKLGPDTSFTLAGRNSWRGSTWVAEGTLTVGDGRTGGTLGDTSSVQVDGLLRFDRADAVRLAVPVRGSGTLEQAGSGTLTLAGANKTHTGTTLVSQGTLQTEGAGALSTGSAVRVLADGRLVLAGAETVQSLRADGEVTLASALTADGALDFKGPVLVAGDGPLQLQAASIDALNAGNRWGSRLSLSTTGAVNLDAGADGAVARALTLGEVEVGDGGGIRAASLLLDGNTRLRGGTLVVELVGGQVPLVPDTTLLGKRTSSQQIAFADDLLRQSESSAARPVALQVDAGNALLVVQAPKGGSVALRNLDNRIDGGLSVVLGEPGKPWVANDQPQPVPTYSLQNRVRLGGSQLAIGGAGIEADVVTIEADSVSTTGTAVIVAKLPYDNTAGTIASLPALTLVLRDPGGFADSGGETTSTFGSGTAPLRVDVGSTSFGNRTGVNTNGGYVTVQPGTRLGGMGRTTVFLQGPLTATGYSFFYDGARRQGTVPVFYNGESAVPPQVSGSISATLSVSEGARKERFDEAVRTENVALRLRAGVIAEVGPGRPATVSGTTLQGLRPPSCTPAPGTLACP